jgi:hypothetical protein
MTLTPKQHRFCIEYLKDENGKAAAIRAGYSPRCAAQQAYELLQNPKVREFIDQEQSDSLDRSRVDLDAERAWVRSRLKIEAEGAETDGARVRALELYGKDLGMFVDRKEVQHTHDHTFFANVDMTEPQLPVDEGELMALPDPTSFGDELSDVPAFDLDGDEGV